MGRVYEQIPHPKISYAYLAIEADTWNEFEKLREESLKRHPLYSTSAFEKKSAPAEVTPSASATGAPVEASVAAAGDGAAEAPQASSPSPAPTSEGLSPRDKARAAAAARVQKGA
jgi:hypothetical protein